MEFNSSDATGTVNYYPYTFNNITRERNILFEGAVPLHEIVYNLYDFCLLYLKTSKNMDTYLTGIIKIQNHSRLSTKVIIKLEGGGSKKKRTKILNTKVPKLIEDFKAIFAKFINEDYTVKSAYRDDIHNTYLQQAYKYFIEDACEKLKSFTPLKL